MTIASKIYQLMKEQNVTQCKLAADLGISKTTLNTWIKDDYDSIPSKYVLPICKALHVTPLKLLTSGYTSDNTNICVELTNAEYALVRAYRRVQKDGAEL